VLRDSERVRIAEPHRTLKLAGGDHLIVHSGGGAGVGRPEQRDPDAVAADVANELVSSEMARNVYKVVVDPHTLELDRSATEGLRKAANAITP
jgi:N-methylhydantoinase B